MDKINMRLWHHLTAPALQGYLQTKFQWSQGTYHSIDWITIGKYLRRVPQGKLTNLIKFQHGLQYTTARKLHIKGHDAEDLTSHDLCPLGCGCAEHNHHYLTCTEQPGYRQVLRETQSLEHALSNAGTHPDLQNILLRSIRAFMSGDTPTLTWISSDLLTETINDAFQEQATIGWHHLFLEHLSAKLKYAQHLFLTQEAAISGNPVKSKSAQLWASMINLLVDMDSWDVVP